MAGKLNISLGPGQLAWLKSRRVKGGFDSPSDVVRDLIRREQEKEWAGIEEQFEALNKHDAAPGPPPIGELMPIVRQVKKELRRRHENNRRA